MRYWDSSALVPLIVREESTPRVRRWLAEDAQVATWAWSRVEVVGAIERRARQGDYVRHDRLVALERLEDIASEWHEVADLIRVRALAESLIARHPLRAADAGQLAAALLVRKRTRGSLGFVSLDRRLAEAAGREGLLLPPDVG